MTGELKFSSDSQWREFRGKQYLNCDDLTEEEMEVVADWEGSTREQRSAICRKNGWEGKGGIFTDQPDGAST